MCKGDKTVGTSARKRNVAYPSEYIPYEVIRGLLMVRTYFLSLMSIIHFLL